MVSVRRIGKKHDPDSKEAVKRYKNKVTIVNLENFYLKENKVYYKDTGIEVLSEDIVLSTDRLDDEYIIREMMFYLAKDISAKRLLKHKQQAKEAALRIKKGITITNINAIDLITLPGSGEVLVQKGTEKAFHIYNIRLSSDKNWTEGELRYILADLCLGWLS
ncbi:MAG: hypothetical protein HC906_08150 [Bacteroidales bacterium]|nr:hypothetical protein [Bacteroidales bacterium]